MSHTIISHGESRSFPTGDLFLASSEANADVVIHLVPLASPFLLPKKNVARRDHKVTPGSFALANQPRLAKLRIGLLFFVCSPS